MSPVDPEDAIRAHAAKVEPILVAILKHVAAGLKREGYSTYEVTPHVDTRCKRAIGVARDPMTLEDKASHVVLYVRFQGHQGWLQTAVVTDEEWFYPPCTTWVWDAKERGVEQPLLEIDRGRLLRGILEELPKPRRLAPVSPKHWMPAKKAGPADGPTGG